MFASSMIRVFPSLEHSAGHVRIPETICRTFLCVPYGTSEQNITARTELAGICPIFNSRCRRVRFARFYIVCEEVPLGTPESPPIVSGVSDIHPSDCPNVEETRNPMQTFSRKKCSHFSQTNFHLHFHMKSPSMFLNHITYQHKAQYASCGSSSSCRISTASSLGSSSASTRHL